jgi:hypothetical protein
VVAIGKAWRSMLGAKAEMEALWAAVFGQPPAIDADPSLLAQLILKCSGPPPVYDTFAAPRPPTATEPEPESEIVEACPPPTMRTTVAPGA